ncbi:MAG: integration host factor subunit alpha [Desulfurivibrionaceae bacterium]|nr:integration host factor subunit alpha [Desulfobulbales bacterium]MDT8334680.1 integration host factor subunit alpha [Desulfurivibrionaceae bacterium]
MNDANLTRKDLARAINEKLGFSKQSAGELVDHVFDSMKSRLLEEEAIKLVQFGTFNIRKKNARVGRNPRTGDTMEICRRSMVSFKPSKGLRERINS